MSENDCDTGKNIENIIIKNLKNNYLSPETIKYKKIGNYILSNTIGIGTFSKVKLGIHYPTQEKVAIKILDKEKIKDENDIERISREIHILKVLKHDNIIQLYENISSERHIYIIMEFINGKNLFHYIYTSKKLNENKACYYFRQLISALEYLHTLGIVHRDIKPENILLTKDYKKIKLVDFGLSNSYRHGNLLKTACGSPCFAAPEMISGKYYNGLYSDLWSCGVVLYYMLTGKLPFDDSNIKVLYRKIKNGDYVIPNFLSDVTKDFIRKILTVNPEKRIKINDLKNHPFFNFDQITLCKGILIGIDDIYIDYDLVKEIKLNYFFDNDKVTEECICEYILKNYHNNITATYYLLLKKKENEKKIENEIENKFENIKENEKNKKEENKQIKNNENDNKNKINDINSKINNNELNENNKNQYQNNNNNNNNDNNINMNNSNNEYNILVINNILTESSINSSNILKNEKKNHPKEKINLINANQKIKLNELVNLNHNLITTKLNINSVISNHIKKNNNSRNINKHKNQALSLGGVPLMNKTTNIFHTLNTYKIGFKKDIKKYIFNSPNLSEENLKYNNLKTYNKQTRKRIISSNLSRNIKSLNQAKTQFKNDNKVKRSNLNKNINGLYIKKLFEKDNSNNQKTNNGNNDVSFNLTNYISNPRNKLIYNFKKNSLYRNQLKPTFHSKQNSKNHSNIYEIENSQKNQSKNNKPQKLIINEWKTLNSFLRNRLSLNLKDSNKKKQLVYNTNSLSNEKDQYVNGSINNKNVFNGDKNIDKNLKRIKNNKHNYLFSNIKTKKNEIDESKTINFGNEIRKNILKQKKQKMRTISNYSIYNYIYNEKIQFTKSKNSTYNSKEKNNSLSIKSSSSKRQNLNVNLFKNQNKVKNLSIKI